MATIKCHVTHETSVKNRANVDDVAGSYLRLALDSRHGIKCHVTHETGVKNRANVDDVAGSYLHLALDSGPGGGASGYGGAV